ncbi:MAG: hypothetical protein KJO31_17845 [Gammaproteobacteria bacterium]|nr:hypothetical protein [Gammaproteobacteria bacterium]
MTVKSAIFALILLISPVASFACRCEQLPLVAYYDRAGFVAMARLVSATDEAERRMLDFELMAAPYKGGDNSHRQGSRLRLYTPLSTASCGIRPDLNAIYVVFATSRDSETNALWVDSCNGTRVHISRKLDEPVGFLDVPAKFVAGQLNALFGLQVLRDVSANAPAADDPSNEKLVGLLDLKALAHGGHTDLYAEASRTASTMARIGSYTDVASREYGYEIEGAVVFATLPGWYRLRLADGRFAWVAADDAGTWFPYEQLPIRRLAYLTDEWSGLVWPNAGAGIPLRASLAADNHKREYPAEVLETTRIGGFPWFRVRVLKNDPCAGGDNRVSSEGWVPAYGRNGDPAVWFYSRGC